ncbi:probable serine/threonine-protein kinase ndrD isoform X1 [Microplitis demolitor]|uniref:probable serine/threonine-protein kinase ndrD isoform X1 n=1 Tax=Microplitis demolitor TaxID=69319 RepID=UPI00235B5E1C|nr:probable serine/threonine-protein kinase ndrD isoform X1 [Microplitis demolitor]XP_008557539.2 probable serine/threonine-protein kinase ndrD isoform X1 [Microplitis demolitor]XP_008557541.2 probable serine/threonine-protein kinase ndrD isoform X1 [Microplitis demolitor]
MSKECRYFVQHVWKEDLCANCFKSREDHHKALKERAKVYVPSPEITNFKSILRDSNGRQSELPRKSVDFPEALTEVIGYGGDYIYSDEESDVEYYDDRAGEKSKSDEHVPENEEDRALNNITRANTNFNRTTANIVDSPSPSSSSSSSSSPSLSTTATTVTTTSTTDAKGLNNLMLGTIQKDNDGKKRTLLVSVTPFKSESTIGPSKLDRDWLDRDVAVRNLTDIKNDSSVTNAISTDKKPKIILDKIVDMPLIESNNFISMTKKHEAKLACDKPDIKYSKASLDLAKHKGLDQVGLKSHSEMINCNKMLKESVNSEEIAIPDLGERTIEGESIVIESLNAEDKTKENVDDDNNDADENNVNSNINNDNSDANDNNKELMMENSREDAGAPDGKAADDEMSESSCSLTHVSTIPRSSFLHGETTFKSDSSPKSASTESSDDNTLSNEISDDDKLVIKEIVVKTKVIGNKRKSHDSCGSQRRQAPKPPDQMAEEESLSTLFARNPISNVKYDSPVVREKEKRERATSCSPKFSRTDDDELMNNQTYSANVNNENSRKSVSLSEYSLNSYSRESLAGDNTVQDKKKGKSRFSLKKLLRIGASRKEMNITTCSHTFAENFDDDSGSCMKITSSSPSSTPREQHTANCKSRPEIIHPLEFNGAAVEVLRHDKLINSPNQSVGRADACADKSRYSQTVAHLGKPPSPPKNVQPSKNYLHSLMKKSANSSPSLKDHKKLDDNWKASASHSNLTNDAIYANLAAEDVAGEVRSGIAPSKPQRTSSIRSVQSQSVKKSDDDDDDTSYHTINIDSVDLSRPVDDNHTNSSSHSIDNDLNIKINEDNERQWKNHFESCLRQRRGRNIFHRNLEDNYNALVIANHESLAQLFQQLVQENQLSSVSCIKRTNLQLNEFNINVDTIQKIGCRIFCSATWNSNQVILCFSSGGLTSLPTYREFFIAPLVEFIDSLPDNLLNNYTEDISHENVTVSVLTHIQVATISSYVTSIRQNNCENLFQQTCLVLLQLVNALKNLQARGIEEFPKSLSNVVLCQEEKILSWRLYLLQNLHIDANDGEEYVSLCQCALEALKMLDLINKFPIIKQLLIRERAVSLSQVKAVLEYSLWGPPHSVLGAWKEREIILQRWLDLERANVLHALIKKHTPLTVADEYQLAFLIHTTGKIMCEASVLLDEQRSDDSHSKM